MNQETKAGRGGGGTQECNLLYSLVHPSASLYILSAQTLILIVVSSPVFSSTIHIYILISGDVRTCPESHLLSFLVPKQALLIIEASDLK